MDALMKIATLAPTPTSVSTPTKVAGAPSPPVILLSTAACLALVALIVALLAYEGRFTAATWQWPLVAFALPFLLVGIPLLIYMLRWGWRLGLHRFEEDTQTDWDGGGIGLAPVEIERLTPVNIPPPDGRIKLSGDERSYSKTDMRRLVDLVWTSQPSARSLRGYRLPSGEILSSYEDDVQPFFRLLARFRLISGFGEGQRYTLSATRDEALARLHLV
jgi:hypothetical protein